MFIETGIPEISDEELEWRLSGLKFYHCDPNTQVLRRIKLDGVDRRKIAFLWDPTLKKKQHPWRKASTYKLCCHTFGAPSLFKPSLAEVVAQIPQTHRDKWVTRVALSPFNLLKAPNCFANIPSEEFGTDTVHIATWALWVEEDWHKDPTGA